MKHIITIITFLIFVGCNKKNKSEVNTTSKAETKEFKTDDVKPFAHEVLSQFTNVRDLTITPEEDEAYFTLLSPNRELSVIMKIKKESSSWSNLEITSFSGKYTDLEPFLSPDGKQLYFASNRPVSKDSTNVKDFDIWYVERHSKDSEWSEPINLGAPINSDADEFYPSIANSKNIYFTAITPETGPQDDIFVSEWENDAYQNPVQLSEAINTKGAEFNTFVSPDESYIIFSGWRREDGIGMGDMYISKKENGIWQKAKNLGSKINSKQTDYCPFVNTKTNTLYFTSRRSNVKKKDSGYFDTTELLTEINRYDNGASRIYSTTFKN